MHIFHNNYNKVYEMNVRRSDEINDVKCSRPEHCSKAVNTACTLIPIIRKSFTYLNENIFHIFIKVS
jgi:hypothetical protein